MGSSLRIIYVGIICADPLCVMLSLGILSGDLLCVHPLFGFIFVGYYQWNQASGSSAWDTLCGDPLCGILHAEIFSDGSYLRISSLDIQK